MNSYETLETSLHAEAHLPDCPNCGAPLPLRRVYRGSVDLVDCEYCGLTVALRTLGPLGRSGGGGNHRAPNGLAIHAALGGLALVAGRKWK